MVQNSEIFVRFTAEGFHSWSGAPQHRTYLANLHRHLFYVEVRCNVTHDDREIEFHDLLDKAKELFKSIDMSEKSCEQMARDLGNSLVQEYDRTFTVEVSEDNECGAKVVVEPTEPTLTPEELNIKFFHQAKSLDDEAKDFLTNAGEDLGSSFFMKSVDGKENTSIQIAQNLIFSNLRQKGNAGGFKKLKDLYDAQVLGYQRIKDLTLESQYIEFYKLYKDDFEDVFDQKTYGQALILMSYWK
jgi:hypothetical protein